MTAALVILLNVMAKALIPTITASIMKNREGYRGTSRDLVDWWIPLGRQQSSQPSAWPSNECPDKCPGGHFQFSLWAFDPEAAPGLRLLQGPGPDHSYGRRSGEESEKQGRVIPVLT